MIVALYLVGALIGLGMILEGVRGTFRYYQQAKLAANYDNAVQLDHKKDLYIEIRSRIDEGQGWEEAVESVLLSTSLTKAKGN